MIVLRNILITFIISVNSSLACEFHTQAALIPKKAIVDREVDNFPGNFSKERFHQIISDVVSLYQDRAKELGTKITSVEKWEHKEFNAYATQDNGEMTIKIYGELARNKNLTEDGFALVVCHELGHHFGGAIKKKMTHPRDGTITLWSVSEGEADYWAGLKCIRKYFKNFGSNQDIQVNEDSHADIIKRCHETWHNTEDRNICLRSALAGESMAKLLLDMRGMKSTVSFSTPSKRVVKRTIHDHTVPQCRLDTFAAAANCNISEDQNIDPDDPSVNTCNRKNDDLEGLRPRCWFQPGDYRM